jgi:hypothetical protein
MQHAEYVETLARLKAQARTHLDKYPQYDGYHDGDEWTLVRFRRSLETKGGLRFAKGEVALARPTNIADPDLPRDGWDAWSVRGNVHVFTPALYVERISPAAALLPA